MACNCEEGSGGGDRKGEAYWKALVWALAINLAMFVIEAVGSMRSGSVALLADAADFLGDSLNYGASLVVLERTLIWRARLALVKGSVMALWGAVVLGRLLWSLSEGTVPVAETMTAISILALVANLVVAAMLYRHRLGDSNRSSVWLCARNDAISNVGVLVAAQLVAFTGRGWPDLLAAGLMAALGLYSGASVIRHARRDLGTI